MRIIENLCIIAGCLTIAGCGANIDRDYTRQPVQKIALLSEGMSKNDVNQILGMPVKTEFNGPTEAWHFCRTGTGVDEFSLVIFSRGKVSSTKNYSVTLADTGGVTGDCSKFVRSAFP